MVNNSKKTRLCPDCSSKLRVAGSDHKWNCDNPDCYVFNVTYKRTGGGKVSIINKVTRVAVL